MTQYLLDSNVISETAKPRPHAGVVRFIADLPAIVLPSVGLYELASGVERLPAGKRRSFLEKWLAELLAAECEVVPLDQSAALTAASLEAEARRRGRSIETRDLLILATAKARQLGIATRDVEHFRGFGVPLYDPFEDAYAR